VTPKCVFDDAGVTLLKGKIRFLSLR